MAESFIEKIKDAAVLHGNAGKILPALIIAQGILESASGTSELATEANNLFGIKAAADWTGEVYRKESAEWSEDIGFYQKVSTFRKYPDWGDCIKDLVAFYQKPRYAEVVGETFFQTAAFASWRSGYATDPNYPVKLLGVFSQHRLEGYTLADKVWAIGAGHAGFGVTPGKRGPDGKVEWEWNNAVVVAAIAHMTTKYKGVKIVRVDDPTGRTDVSLQTRERRVEAAKADAYTSVHHNAMGSKWLAHALGIETFVMTPISANPQSYALAQAVHPNIVKAMGLKDRGIKAANFYVLRETENVAAILTEGGFMDSRIDRKNMDTDAIIRRQGVALADGVAKFLKLQTAATAPTAASVKWFRVRKTWIDAKSQIGAFVTLDEAKKLVDQRQAEGYEVYDHTGKIVYEVVAEKKWFRIRKAWTDPESQLAAFQQLDQAMDIINKPEIAIQGYKIYDDSGRLIYTPVYVPIAEPEINAPPQGGISVDDKDKVHGTLAEEFEEAKEMKITDGSDPNGTTTRVQTAVMIVRAVKYILTRVEK